MVDLNQDLGSIIKDLMKKGDGSADSSADGGAAGQVDVMAKIMPFRNAIIFFMVIVVTSIAYHQAYYKKTSQTIIKKKEEIARLEGLKTETSKLATQIASMRKKMHSSRRKYIDSLSHFGNSEDLGELYRSISILASKYDLTVLNIKEIPPPPPKPKPLNSKKDKDAPVVEEPITKVTEVEVEVELKGAYGDYIRFKEDLAVAEMLLKVNSEKVKVKKDEQGKIFSTLSLTTYAIDKSKFESVIEDNANAKGKGEGDVQ